MLTTSSRIIAGATLAVLLAGGLAAPAPAGGSHFKGKTGQGPAVTFTVKPKKVTGFKTSATVLCLSVATGRSLTEIYPVRLQSPTPLKKGKFAIDFTPGIHSLTITVKGKVKGDKASGTLDIKYTKFLGSSPTGGLDVGACSAKTTWTAKRK